MEVNAENSSSVYEASQALVSRGAEALWVGGDNTVEIAMDMMVKAARSGKIPVFCNNPDMPAKGALFGLGANYYQVGVAAGNIAADMLEGANPASIPVENVVPEKLFINRKALQGLKDNWSLSEELVKRADKIIN